MKSGERKVTTLNNNHPGPGIRIAEDRYNAMRDAILSVVPFNERGVLFKELPRLVEPHLPTSLSRGASVSWYTTTVKLGTYTG